MKLMFSQLHVDNHSGDHLVYPDRVIFLPNGILRAEQIYLAQIERRRRDEDYDRVRTKAKMVEEELERVREVSKSRMLLKAGCMG